MSKVIHYTTKNEEGKFAVTKYYPSDEEVEKIMNVLTGKNRPVQIEWRGNLLKTSNIEVFDKDEKNQTGFQKTSYTDEEIKEFEQILKDLEQEPLKYPLSYYGEDCEKIAAIEIGKYKFPENIKPRRVRNDVTGLAGAVIIQHLLRINAISRRHVKEDSPGYGWAVGPDLKAYEDFYQKKGALDELRYKREYAQEKETEAFDALVESREALSKSMEMLK